ncbi:MAG: hypothetical protein OIF48_06555 [Silicimonas sp.]|nr:hypothetical protein [Silicimonas sp.]
MTRRTLTVEDCGNLLAEESRNFAHGFMSAIELMESAAPPEERERLARDLRKIANALSPEEAAQATTSDEQINDDAAQLLNALWCAKAMREAQLENRRNPNPFTAHSAAIAALNFDSAIAAVEDLLP